MKKKRRHAEIDQSQCEQAATEPSTDEPPKEEEVVEKEQKEVETPTLHEKNKQIEQSFERSFDGGHRQKKFKQVYQRVAVDPSRKYHTPESRESWGPNVKGKKFRKEKGKKKRCPNAGVRIDGAVKSIRFD